jgi:hypothetical protein
MINVLTTAIRSKIYSLRNLNWSWETIAVYLDINMTGDVLKLNCCDPIGD